MAPRQAKVPSQRSGTGGAAAVVEQAPCSQRIRRLLRILWMLAVLMVIVGSVLPRSSLPMRALNHFHINDKIEHTLAYAALAFLPAIHERKKIVAAVAAGALTMGIGLEYVQLYSGWRDFEVADMIADAVGVCCGLITGLLARLCLAGRA